ncbi:MAG: choice-of-anchor L domain-containing protein, partial [Flavobacteriaceae bacterium]
MLNKLTIFFSFLFVHLSFSQAIDVNPIGAPESDDILSELVNETLTDHCSSGTNITYRYCNDVNNTGAKSFGYFQYTPPMGQQADDTNFPFEEGIILSTGSSLTAEGPNPADPVNVVTGNGTQTYNENGVMTGNGGTSWIGDPDIKEILDDRLGGNLETFNATVVEFDFFSLTSDLSFDYLFTSEEWESGINECPGSDYLDGFAFIITGPGIIPDLKSNGQPFAHGGKNIALIPNTNIPVSAGSIYNNMQCAPDATEANEDLYISYTNANAANSPVNFNARTVKLTAQETVIAGETYHLKLVVADRGDTLYDSAVLLAADSFTTAPTLTINGVEVGETQPVCQGSNETVTINGEMIINGLSGAVEYQWLHNGIEMTQANGYPQDEDHYELTTNINGTYTLIATLPLASGNCDTIDSATITFLPDTTIGNVPDMNLCDSGDGTASFPIDTYNNTLLNGQDPTLYSVTYHLTEEDALSGDAPITSPYIGPTQEIFTRVMLTNNPEFCYATGSFFATVNTIPTATQPVNPIRICDDLANGQYLEEFDLTQVEDEILNGQSPADVTITYYDNSTTPPTVIPNTDVTNYLSGTKTIGAVVSNNNNTNCTTSTTFEIITDLIPLAPMVTEMSICDDDNDGVGFFDLNSIIPSLTNGVTTTDVVFYETLEQAELGLGAINTTEPYQNLITGVYGQQTIYVNLTTNGTSCQITVPFTLIVIDSPELPSEPLVYSICDDY